MLNCRGILKFEMVHERKKLDVNLSKCDICDAKFQDKRGLKRHIESIHEEKKAQV